MDRPKLQNTPTFSSVWLALGKSTKQVNIGYLQGASILHQMSRFNEANKFFDVVLVAGADNTRLVRSTSFASSFFSSHRSLVSFSAHRLFLSAASPYFATIFDHEPSGEGSEEITLENVRGDDLQRLIQFLYTGIIVVNEQNVQKTLEVAKLLQMKELVLQCCTFIEERMDVETCLAIGNFAEELRLRALYVTSQIFVSQNFMQVQKSDAFLEISYSRIQDLLARNNLVMESEEIAVSATLRWVNHDIAARKKYIPQLLENIRMVQLTPAVKRLFFTSN